MSLNSLEDNLFTNISAGFQHSIFLTGKNLFFIKEKNEIFGCGKYDKNQLGKKYVEKNNTGYSFSELICGMENLEIYLKDEKIIDVGCGKYHSLFLTGNF